MSDIRVNSDAGRQDIPHDSIKQLLKRARTEIYGIRDVTERSCGYWVGPSGDRARHELLSYAKEASEVLDKLERELGRLAPKTDACTEKEHENKENDGFINADSIIV